MLSELQRIGSCVVPGEKAKAPAPTSSVHGMQLRCAPVWWKYASTIYGTQRILVRTSDCGTFDPRASSNSRIAPEAVSPENAGGNPHCHGGGNPRCGIGIHTTGPVKTHTTSISRVGSSAVIGKAHPTDR